MRDCQMWDRNVGSNLGSNLVFSNVGLESVKRNWQVWNRQMWDRQVWAVELVNMELKKYTCKVQIEK